MFIDKQKILDATDQGLTIIKYYFPNAVEGKAFKSREGEKTASSRLKKNENGDWSIIDFGDDGRMRNAIDITMEKEGISFKDALELLAERYNVEGKKGEKVVRMPHIKGPFKSEDGLIGYEFEFNKNFTEKELLELGPWVKPEHCMKYNLKSVKLYRYHKPDGTYLEFHSTENFPIFCFDMGDWQKIYQPCSSDKQYRFRYSGKKPKDYIFGLDVVKKKHAKLVLDEEELDEKDKKHKLPEVVICSGDRDAINMAALGYEVIWLNSESATLSHYDFDTLKYACHSVYNLPDLDTTGKIKALEKALEFIDLKTIWLPDYISGKRDHRGNACKDFTDFCKYFRGKAGQKNTLIKDVKTIMEVAMPTKFWSKHVTKNGNTKYSYNTEYALNFFKNSGYYRFEAPEGKEGYFYVHIQDNVVKKIDPTKISEIKTYCLKWARDKKFPIPVVNLIHDNSSKFNDGNINSLPFIDIDFTDNDEFTQYYFYRNETWKITKSGIEAIPNNKVNKFVWKDRVIDKKVSVDKPYFKIKKNPLDEFDIEIFEKDCQILNYLINTSRVHWRYELENRFKGKGSLKAADKDSYFKANQFNIAGPNFTNHKNEEDNGLGEAMVAEQKQHLINKIFSIGYLLHGYKNADKAWAVFAMDNKLSGEGESFGGSGKSLLYEKIIPFFLGKFFKNGRERGMFDDKHVYDGLTKHNKYVIFEDTDRYFKFSNLFAPITSDWQVNPKNNQPFTIPFSESPKIAITSNFTLNNFDGSTLRRILYTVFSDYYHHKGQEGGYLEDRTVGSDFNNTQFLTQWNDAEYNRFINFMMQCLQFYLSTNEKYKPPMGNVVKRNLITEMSESFKNWADVYFHPDSGRLDAFLIQEKIVADAISDTKNHKQTSNSVTKRLKAWCKYYGYVFNPEELASADGRIIKKVENQSKAHVYIKTIFDKEITSKNVMTDDAPF